MRRATQLHGCLHRSHVPGPSRRGRPLTTTLALTRRAPPPALVHEIGDEAARATLGSVERARITQLVGNPLGRGVVMASALVVALMALGRRRDEADPS